MEHVMIMFCDLPLTDDIVCIKQSYEQRRQRLESLIHQFVGRADVGSRETIDFHLTVLPVCFGRRSPELSHDGGKDS